MNCPTQADCEALDALEAAAYILVQQAQVALDAAYDAHYAAESAWYSASYAASQCWYDLINCNQFFATAEDGGIAEWTPEMLAKLIEKLPPKQAVTTIQKVERMRRFEAENPEDAADIRASVGGAK